jgi:hypothetical protein
MFSGGTAIGVVSTAAAQSNDRQPTITTPSAPPGYRPTIQGGRTNPVAGTGCRPGDNVEVNIHVLSGRIYATTVAAPDGTWQTAIDVPVVPIDDSIEEAREWSLNVSCGDLQNSLIVTYLDPLARTGPPLELAALALVGLSLVTVGVGATRASRRLRTLTGHSTN